MIGQAPTADRRSHALDGLRGYAACAVAFYHAIFICDPTLVERVSYQPIQALETTRDVVTKMALTVLNGETAVFLFFILSGCVLRLSLQRRADSPAIPLCIGFAANRVMRLYPPLIIRLLLMMAFGWLGLPGFPRFTWEQVALNSSLLKITMHGASSTIQAEMLAVPFLLVAWLLRKRFGIAPLVLCFAAGVLALQGEWIVLHLRNMHLYISAFMAEMLAAEPGLRQFLGSERPSMMWAALAFLVFGRIFHPVSLPAFVAMGIAGALLVAGLMHDLKGSLSAFLERPYAQSLGRLSYSLYLLNIPALWFVSAVWGIGPWEKAHALEAALAIGFLSIVVAWPFAWASERWVERPSIMVGRKLAELVARRRQGPFRKPFVSASRPAKPA
jgi:peptidoglycan/LPS O-acetylase OafA/YrhL